MTKKKCKQFKEFAEKLYLDTCVEEIMQKIIKKDTEYKKLVNEGKAILQELQQIMPQNKYSILLDYEANINDKFSRLIELLIKQILKEVKNYE